LFQSLKIEFHPKLTVLVANNSGGKTAILDAAHIAVDSLTSVLGKAGKGRNIEITDVRHKVDSPAHGRQGVILASGIVDNEECSWNRSQRFGVSRILNGRTGLKKAHVQAMRMVDKEELDKETLPSVAYYGTSRKGSAIEPKEFFNLSDRFSVYREVGNSAVSFRTLSLWYKSQFEELGHSSAYAQARNYRPEQLLAAVNHAVDTVLKPTKWHDLSWSKDALTRHGHGALMVTHPQQGRQPIDHLSDGLKSVIGLIGNFAARCARLNPHLGEDAVLQTPGILIIDEVDLHLHPSWQQQIIFLLMKAFPNQQLLVTTHSPQVITSVSNESIRIIENNDGMGQCRKPELQTKGVESADALARVMGVDPIPKIAEAIWLSSYRAMIEQDEQDTEKAQQLRDKLVSHFGPNHPVMLDCNRLARFQRFKRKHIPGPTPSV
jgi:predicted ATP-binding protein involved in virulence